MRCLAEFVQTVIEPRRLISPNGTARLPEPRDIETEPLAAELMSALAYVDPAEYSTWVAIGQALASLGVTGRNIWFEWSSRSPKFDYLEADTKWPTFTGERTGVGAVFAAAMRGGWRNSTSNYANSVAILPSVDAFGKVFAEKFAAPSPLKTTAWEAPPAISYQEFYMASASPDAIIAGLYYADVGIFIAPGGTGKTTLMLYILLHIALGRELWGMPIVKPGPVLIITAEDSREMLVARLRSICAELGLTQGEIQTVAQRVLISDVSGVGLKLTEVHHDVVRPHSVIDQIIEACGRFSPVIIVIDPAVSFGVGESRVNDAEQGLVEAGRRLRNALNCCILYVHHTGKANARDKALDQYAGRGGSAFADGSRMVHVIVRLDAGDWLKATGEALGPAETGLLFARPKMSYSMPQPDIYIKRTGFVFERVLPKAETKEDKVDASADKLHSLLHEELEQGRYHSENSLQDIAAEHGIKPRGHFRLAVARLKDAGRIIEQAMPDQGRGGKKAYLHPVASPSPVGEPNAERGETLV